MNTNLDADYQYMHTLKHWDIDYLCVHIKTLGCWLSMCIHQNIGKLNIYMHTLKHWAVEYLYAYIKTLGSGISICTH